MSIDIMAGLPPTQAWKVLCCPKNEPAAFTSFDLETTSYLNRTGDWPKTYLAQDVLERTGASIPYTVRGGMTGRKSGRPTRLVMTLPGGPGTALSDGTAKANASPELYRLLTANWRGVGNATPQGAFATNTTPELVADMEALRRAASLASGTGGEEKIVLCGGSWGMSMAVAYAAAYPKAVAGLVLRLPFLASRTDITHNYSADGALAKANPESYAAFFNLTRKADPSEMLLQLFDELSSPDDKRVRRAFNGFATWEAARNGERFDPSALAGHAAAYEGLVNRARVMTFYTANNFFLPEDGVVPLLAKVPKDIPVVVLAHAADPLGRPDTLSLMKAQLPQAEFYVKEANWHWIARENEQPETGFDNSFASEGCPFGLGRVGLALSGEVQMAAGVQTFNRRSYDAATL